MKPILKLLKLTNSRDYFLSAKVISGLIKLAKSEQSVIGENIKNYTPTEVDMEDRKWVHVGGDLEASKGKDRYVDVRGIDNPKSRLFMSEEVVDNLKKFFTLLDKHSHSLSLSTQYAIIKFASSFEPPISFMRLKKIKSPEELAEKHNPADLIAQIKIDGWKGLISKGQEHTIVLSRRGESKTDNIPEIIQELENQLPSNTSILGEVSVLDENGKQSISLTQTLMGSNPQNVPESVHKNSVFYVYDILQFEGQDITKKPFKYRDELLRKTIKPSQHIQLLTNYDFKDIDKAVEYALSVGGEGCVIKNKNGAYLYNAPDENEPMSDSQWKYKPAGEKSNVDEVIIQNYEMGESKAIFPAYQFRDSKLFEVGHLSGLDKTTEQQVKNKIDRGEKLVVEITDQERNPDTGKYRHMGFSRMRPDKNPKDVTFEK